MEKRALAAIALSVLVLFAFRYFEERRVGDIAKKRGVATAPSAKRPETPPEATQIAPAPVETPAPSSPGAGDTTATQKKIVIDGGLYRAVLDNRGAVLTSWELKRYKSLRGLTFEMIAGGHEPEARPFPGSLTLEDPALTKNANWDYYDLEVAGGEGESGNLVPPVTVLARLRRGNLSIEKRYRFENDNYVVELSVKADNGGNPLPARVFVAEDIGPEDEHLLNPSVQLAAVYERDAKVRRESPPKEESEIKKIDGGVRWVGLELQYFAIIGVPAHPVTFEIQKKSIKSEGLDRKEITRDLLKLAVPESGPSQWAFYIGPKQQSYLESVKGADLSGAINYGMFSFLVRPLLLGLKWIDRYTHNFGTAIVLLTFLLTILLFPFRLKQMLSMKKMAVVQPKVKAIQEKYRRYKKTDPKRAEMNQEIMALYKEHNVNPLGGCLPLLLQMPLLFAFYSLLQYSIELRQAPFMAWIHDLSVKDPYYVLPIIMGVTMLISQKMTPMAPGSDPAQAKMMMVMPAVFTVMFLNVSAGLNLYFLCSNVFQISFQKIAERWVGDQRIAVKSRS